MEKAQEAKPINIKWLKVVVLVLNTSIKWFKTAVIIFLSLPYHVCSLLLLFFSLHTFKINVHIWHTNVYIYCYRGLSYFATCDPMILDPMMYDSCINYQCKLKLCLKIYKTRIMQQEHYILLKKRPRVFASCEQTFLYHITWNLAAINIYIQWNLFTADSYKRCPL